MSYEYEDSVLEPTGVLEPQGYGGALMRRRASSIDLGDPEDPASFWLWPPTLAMEIAMRAEPVQLICEAYDISQEEWHTIRGNPVFIAELTKCVEDLRREGAAFRMRAQMQSLELLKDSWKMIHDPSTPHAVKADLIKFTIKVAGLDASKDQGILGKSGGAGGFVINVNLG